MSLPPEQLQKTGMVLVEGPINVINLHTLGIPAMAVCSNLITETQAEKWQLSQKYPRWVYFSDVRS